MYHSNDSKGVEFLEKVILLPPLMRGIMGDTFDDHSGTKHFYEYSFEIDGNVVEISCDIGVNAETRTTPSRDRDIPGEYVVDHARVTVRDMKVVLHCDGGEEYYHPRILPGIIRDYLADVIEKQ